MTTITIVNQSKPEVTLHAKVADTFFSKWLGLMFSRQIPHNCGLLLVDRTESRIYSSIHMLFMNYDLFVVWLDRQNRVVDCMIAKRWRLAYMPKKKALSVLELSTEQSGNFKIDDQITIIYEK